MASVRDIFIRLGVKTDPKGFKQANSGLNKITSAAKAAVTALAAFKGVQLIKGATEEVRALGDRLDKVSQQIGVSTDALQELDFAAGLAGASSQDLETALRILARNANEAADGSQQFADDFKKLGVNVTDTNGNLKSTDQLLTELADGMAGLESNTERTALAQSLLGRSGAKLIPMLTQGSKRIREQRKEARELGLLDKDLIQASVELTDNQLRLQKAFNVVKFAIARALLPFFNRTTKGLIEFLKANREIIRQRITKFFKGFARVIGTVWDVISRLVNSTRMWVQSLDPVAQQVLKITGLIIGLAAVMLLPGGAIFLLAAAIALLIEDFEMWRRGGKSVIGDLLGDFATMEERFPNLVAAVRKVGQAFVAVFEGIGELIAVVLSFVVDLFERDFVDAISNLLTNFLDTGLGQFFIDMKDGFVNAVTGMFDIFKEFVNDIGDSLANIPVLGKILTGSAAAAGTLAGGGGPLEAFRAAIGAGGPGEQDRIAAPAGAGGTVAQSQTNNTQVTVNAAPGMNTQDLAELIPKEIRREQERQNRQAARQFAVEAP